MTSSRHASATPAAGIWTGSLSDLRHAFRLLWKSKRTTATTLVTLALCIGATTAIFSSVYSLMLKPLPYQEPQAASRVVHVGSEGGPASNASQRPVLSRLLTERDILRADRTLDVRLRDGR